MHAFPSFLFMQRTLTPFPASGFYFCWACVQEAAHGLDRVHIAQLLKPLRQALDAAIMKHDNETVFKAQPAHDLHAAQ